MSSPMSGGAPGSRWWVPRTLTGASERGRTLIRTQPHPGWVAVAAALSPSATRSPFRWSSRCTFSRGLLERSWRQ
jgi:hypothetical protein